MGNIHLTNYYNLLPELYLLGWTIFLLVYGVYRSPRSNHFLVLAGVLVFTMTAFLGGVTFHETTVVMNGMFIIDRFGVMAKWLILAASSLVLLLSTEWLKEEGGRPFEYVILMMLSVLGMMLLVSAGDMLTLYMALEMMSLALYVLAAFNRDHTRSTEAGLKYFVLGALASGMMLFGISLVYGFAGTTNFATLSALFSQESLIISKGVILGMIMVMVGLCFKVSAVPFHMWSPDVYEGAPTPVTAFFSTAPKVAALALFARVMLEPFGHLVSQWQQIVIFVSVASMLVGALAAIKQTSIKRLLAYSSIGHAGFMLMALAAANMAGVQAILIYLAVYIFMSGGMLGCVMLMRRNGEYVENISDLAGLGKNNPLLAGVIAVYMFAMIGIPPLSGFFGKWYAVLAAVSAGLTWLAVIGVASSVIGAFYYIKVVKVMYFDEPAHSFDKGVSKLTLTGIVIATLVTLFYCVYPTPLVTEAALAAQSLLQ